MIHLIRESRALISVAEDLIRNFFQKKIDLTLKSRSRGVLLTSKKNCGPYFRCEICPFENYSTKLEIFGSGRLRIHLYCSRRFLVFSKNKNHFLIQKKNLTSIDSF
jgi:hypothetical protein